MTFTKHSKLMYNSKDQLLRFVFTISTLLLMTIPPRNQLVNWRNNMPTGAHDWL